MSLSALLLYHLYTNDLILRISSPHSLSLTFDVDDSATSKVVAGTPEVGAGAALVGTGATTLNTAGNVYTFIEVSTS